MNHATAFAPPRNPSDDGDALSSALEHAREATARPGSDNDDESSPPLQSFFRQLDRRSCLAKGADGCSWDRFFSDGQVSRAVALCDRSVAGLSGVLQILAADFAARTSGDASDHHLADNLVYGLMLAAEELNDRARDGVEDLRDRMEKLHDAR